MDAMQHNIKIAHMYRNSRRNCIIINCILGKQYCVLLLSLILYTSLYVQKKNFFDAIIPRARVIIDNDFGGGPDGLFQSAIFTVN